MPLVYEPTDGTGRSVRLFSSMIRMLWRPAKTSGLSSQKGNMVAAKTSKTPPAGPKEKPPVTSERLGGLPTAFGLNVTDEELAQLRRQLRSRTVQKSDASIKDEEDWKNRKS
jgi:hypothetical protein